MRVPVMLAVSFALAGCAQGGDDPASAPAADSAAPGDVAIGFDTGDARDSRDAVIDAVGVDGNRPDASGGEADAIFPVDDGAVGLCATPTGTSVTASGSYMSTPDSVVDGKLDTGWNSGGYSGSLRLKFPKAVRFDRIHIAAGALPACAEPYGFKGYLAGVETLNATQSMAVPEGSGWLPIVEVTAGDYDELLIDVGTSASWIFIAEIVVFDSTAKCPP